jgi:hypothetical protein
MALLINVTASLLLLIATVRAFVPGRAPNRSSISEPQDDGKAVSGSGRGD